MAPWKSLFDMGVIVNNIGTRQYVHCLVLQTTTVHTHTRRNAHVALLHTQRNKSQ